VLSENLVGSDKYVKAFTPAANETYPVGLTQGVTITVTGVAGSRTVTFTP
jgi:type IV pilus assembly protein PilA